MVSYVFKSSELVLATEYIDGQKCQLIAYGSSLVNPHMYVRMPTPTGHFFDPSDIARFARKNFNRFDPIRQWLIELSEDPVLHMLFLVLDLREALGLKEEDFWV